MSLNVAKFPSVVITKGVINIRVGTSPNFPSSSRFGPKPFELEPSPSLGSILRFELEP